MVFVGQVADVSSLLPATCLQVGGGVAHPIILQLVEKIEWEREVQCTNEVSDQYWYCAAVGIMVGVIASKKSNAYTCKYEMNAITKLKL